MIVNKYLVPDINHISTTLSKHVRVSMAAYNGLNAVKVVESAHTLGIGTIVYEHTFTYKYNIQFQNDVCGAIDAKNEQCILDVEAQVEGETHGFPNGNEINLTHNIEMRVSL